MTCHLEEFASQVAAMLKGGASQEDIDRVLAAIIPEYRTEVLAAARELLASANGT